MKIQSKSVSTQTELEKVTIGTQCSTEFSYDNVEEEESTIDDEADETDDREDTNDPLWEPDSEKR